MPIIGQKVRHIIPISGKDSLCTAIVQMTRNPNLKYEFLFCDVRMELPETYEWLAKVEQTLEIEIVRVGKSLESVIAEVGKLPGFHYRFCTKNAKIYPMQDYIGRDTAIQYIGFRADEENRIPPSGTERANIKTKFPLIEMGITMPLVYRILDDRNVLPPSFFWQRLYDEVYEQVGHVSKKFMREVPPWAKSYLFSWRSRSNCFMCFYQRLYEWVGLLEFHPDLFAKAEEMERVYGGAKSEFRLERHEGDPTPFSDYHFHQGWPLSKIRDSADSLFQKRVWAVAQAVNESRHKPVEELDMMALTSCGAYCGK